MNRMTKLTLVIGPSLAVLAGAAVAHDHAVSRGRLVFADHEQPKVSILDLDSGEVTHDFEMPKPNPVLATTEDGRYTVIKAGDDAGTVRFLDTGLTYESHGDHADVEKGEVRLLDYTLRGDKPGHVVSKNGWIAVFFDGHRPWERASEPGATFVKLDTLNTAKPTTRSWKSPAPQHGIAFALGADEWLVSTHNEPYARGDQKASSRSNGFRVVSGEDSKVVSSFDDLSDPQKSCKEFHGHASLNNVHVFGCAQGPDDDAKAGGVLVLRKDHGQWRARRVAYPDNRRMSTIKAREGGQYLIANYGNKGPYDALIRIDPKAATLKTEDIFQVPDGQAVCQFEVASNGKRVANLTADGKLRIYDSSPAWKQVAQFDAVPAFDCAYGARTPTPSLAIVGENAFVSDPVNKRIREYSLGSLQQGLDLPVEGTPANLANGGGG
ncbi:hypothetical protein [Microvirga lotononidis]|uniref:Uncharacterized protein n=1 Tax=Microvirga lotononidis TaxID=864069 RepID=I4Z103_9HYPH|nr:hypothetical protein [Microvirga lotononidis]EIM29895.1 hypothetical protein MicloDRAFT_00012160 [Microvirga lotononidis]WQO31026.1 hypothetical protein U0023_32445 [Microvirga lotononidis]